MSNNSEIAAANNEAIKALQALHPEDSERLLNAAYASRGLTRRRRLNKEQRAAADLAAKQEKARARIAALAEKAGIAVSLEGSVQTPVVETDEERAARERFETLPQDVRDGIVAAQNATFVSVDTPTAE